MAKKKSRFNVIDAVILLLVIGLIGSLVYWGLSEKSLTEPEGEKTKIRYVLRMSEIKDSFVENVEKGDAVYEASTEKTLGKVIAVSSAKSNRIGTNMSTGAQVVSPVEGRSDLYITIESEALFIGGRYFIEDIAVAAGMSLEMMTPELTGISDVISVEIVG